MAYSEGVLTAPITTANLMAALGRAGGVGYVIKNGRINPMAKYKAVKSSKTSPLTNSDRAAVRYGLVAPGDYYPNSKAIPTSWTYDRPTAGQPNEWFRVLDFNGYDINALPPLALDMQSGGGLKVGGGFAIILWKDSYVNTYGTIIGTSGKWYSDRSLSVQEILGSASSYYDRYIAFVFGLYNTEKSAITDVAVVTTGLKFGNIDGSSVFRFYPQGDGASGDYIEGGVRYPIIPLLRDATYAGRQFLVAVCLSSTGAASGYAYQNISASYPCLSLGFDSSHRWDYALAVASSSSAIDSLECVFNSGPTLTYITQHSGGWNEYSCAKTITATITRPAGWTGANVTIEMTAIVLGGAFGGTPDSSSAYNPFTYRKENVSIPAGSGAITVSLTTIPHAFIFKDAPKVVNVTAVVKQSTNIKSFDNTLVISG